MIHLMQPMIPNMVDVEPYLRSSRRENQFTNFGPCWREAAARLSDHLYGHALPVNNGTAGLELALMTTFDQGSRIAIPELTFIATAQAVKRAGMVPVVFPVDTDTWSLQKEILYINRDNIDGFIAVAPFGYWIDFAAYDKIAEVAGLKVVYDLCGAWGMNFETVHPRVYSFHATKNLSIGEGGCVVFSTEAEMLKAKQMMNFSFDHAKVPHSLMGSNFKMDEIHAAMVLYHLDRHHHVAQRIARRRELIAYYKEKLFDGCERFALPRVSLELSSPNLCVLNGFDPLKLETEGPKHGVSFRRGYSPLLSSLAKGTSLLESECGFPRFTLGSTVAFPSDVTDAQAKKVVEVAKRVLNL